MSKIYYGDRASGGSLKHYRTKGSRNGYSKNPNYKVVGQRAKGRWVNGRYVYDNPYLSSYGKLKKAGVNEAVRSIDNGAKNNWQQQANETSATNRMLNEHLQKRTATVNMLNNNTTHKAMQKHNIFTKGWDGAIDNSYANASARVAAGKRVSTPHRTQVASAKIEALSKKGAKNNWQQQGNHFRAADEAVNRMAQERSDNAYIGNGSKAANAAMKKYLRDDGVALRRDESYRNALNRHEHKKQMANSERLMSAKGAKNDWQQRANREAAAQSVENKIRNDSSKAAYIPRRHGGDMYVNPSNLEIDTERKPNKTPGANAMRNDPRYNLYDSMKIEEAKRIASAKARANKEKAAKRNSLINKIKDKISSFFKKKKK